MKDPINHSLSQQKQIEIFRFLEKYDLFDPIPGGLLSYPKKDDDNDPDRNGHPPAHG